MGVLGDLTFCRKAVETKEQLVRYFYDREPESYFRYIHERGGTREECIRDTLQTISPKTVFYNVYDEEQLVATFGKYHDELMDEYGLEMFHVLREYRVKAFLSIFSDIIKDHFHKTFYAGAYEQNNGAVRFLVKAGFQKINEMEQKDKKVLIFKFEK